MIKTDINNIFSIIKNEEKRQTENIELIASENYVSDNVLKALGSVLTNKYAEGYPGKRYYGGCHYIDEIEQLAIDKAQELFDTDYKVNVQPHSGSSANMGAYFSVLKPGDTIMGLELVSGGHLTHGSKPSFSGDKFGIFKSVSYGTNEEGLLDYNKIREIALKERPKLIIAGASAYSRIIDWKEFRKIADEINAYLLVDMAHIAGLIATGLHPSPFGIADFVTTTTHKTLRGPRGGVIFSKTEELGKKVDSIIFPGIQGGPLENIIAAKAICFVEGLNPSFKEYQQQVLKNAKVFERELSKYKLYLNGKSYKLNIVTGGTDNHLLLLDFSEIGISGKKIEELLEEVNITVNMNTVPGDTTPFNPSGIRIGTPAITSRGIKEDGIKEIADTIKDTIDNYFHGSSNNIEIYKKRMIKLVKELSIQPIL